MSKFIEVKVHIRDKFPGAETYMGPTFLSIDKIVAITPLPEHDGYSWVQYQTGAEMEGVLVAGRSAELVKRIHELEKVIA